MAHFSSAIAIRMIETSHFMNDALIRFTCCSRQMQSSPKRIESGRGAAVTTDEKHELITRIQCAYV